jgi:hypothetical protein
MNRDLQQAPLGQVLWVYLKSQASLRQTKLEPFVKEFLKAKEEIEVGFSPLLRFRYLPEKIT